MMKPLMMFMVFLCVPILAGAQPQVHHGLHYETPAATWDEGMPLGNGLLGALVWGDGRPLNISLDRTDLWDLRPVPEFHSDEYSYALMRRWVAEERLEDLQRVYEKPYSLYAGRRRFRRAGLNWGSAISMHASGYATIKRIKRG